MTNQTRLPRSPLLFVIFKLMGLVSADTTDYETLCQVHKFHSEDEMRLDHMTLKQTTSFLMQHRSTDWPILAAEPIIKTGECLCQL